MNPLIKSTSVFVFIPILFCACSASPEEFGRKLAEKECQCDLLKVDLDTRQLQQTYEDLKAKKFKTQMEIATTNYSEMFSSDSAALASCKEEQSRMEKEAAQKFVDGDDRTTFTNAYTEQMRSGQEEIKKKQKTRSSIERETYIMMRALPLQ